MRLASQHQVGERDRERKRERERGRETREKRRPPSTPSVKTTNWCIATLYLPLCLPAIHGRAEYLASTCLCVREIDARDRQPSTPVIASTAKTTATAARRCSGPMAPMRRPPSPGYRLTAEDTRSLNPAASSGWSFSGRYAAVVWSIVHVARRSDASNLGSAP